MGGALSIRSGLYRPDRLGQTTQDRATGRETVQLKVPWNTGLGDYTNPASSSGAVALTRGVQGLQVGLFETKKSGTV